MPDIRAERGGGACLARSIAGENEHDPTDFKSNSFLPAENLALDQQLLLQRLGRQLCFQNYIH